ncbi:uncharacterized protein EV422DRAFT_504737 [Fimicolochytrium jonesii]|uniref:uncharacterized protein n=1 Tax=Fimicolochytrium jonesii TaxID=1396493 RepID=UPI0022FEFFA0|nr:uncharacterized protein EV422DRAFT_504737 [Fimicolochytrium jonesii]KAI8823547.1 hypothetical protein EV422DRAFT_504737 [Fimicolochytrium jonesii]
MSLPLPVVCCEFGTGPCGCKVVGPTLGFLFACIAAIPFWLAGAVLWIGVHYAVESLGGDRGLYTVLANVGWVGRLSRKRIRRGRRVYIEVLGCSDGHFWGARICKWISNASDRQGPWPCTCRAK